MTLANKITIGRILAVPFFVATVLYYHPEKDYLRFVALGIFLAAALSDLVDGYIARTQHQKTRAGAILDPIADKLLVISGLICLYRIGGYFDMAVQLPLWLIVVLISRDTFLLIGTGVIQVIVGRVEIVPNMWGKAAAFVQVLCIVGMLLQWPFSFIIWYMALVTTGVSIVLYVSEGIRILNADH